jgi:hypothetical protein
MSLTERIRHEIREIGLVTAYFLAWFLFFLTLKQLLLEEYQVDVAVLRTAIIGALVVAKVVVVLDKTRFADRFRSGPLIAHVVWRAVGYTAIVFGVTLVERFYDVYREHGDVHATFAALWARRDYRHFLAMNLTVAVAFVVFNSLNEIDRRLGEGGLRRLFFAVAREPGAPTSSTSPPSSAASTPEGAEHGRIEEPR